MADGDDHTFDETLSEREAPPTSPRMVAVEQSMNDHLMDLLGSINSAGSYTIDQRTARRISALCREAIRFERCRRAMCALKV